MKDLLISLGAKVELIKEKKIIKITNNKRHKLVVPYNLVSTMRAGVLTMGPLLARYPKNKIKVALGGVVHLVLEIHHGIFQDLKVLVL